jgi:hypothetical protein
MIKPDWQVFGAKFSGKEQDTFEWFSSILFCLEFNKKTGIPRYKNNPGIERHPIEVGNELVGFQAKFYEGKLSEKKQDIQESISIAKRKYPTLNKILFYLNRDFSEGPTQKGIEEFASKLGVQIVWRSAWYFESHAVCVENEKVAKYFFSQNKSVVDFMEDLSLHTSSILYPVNSKINFNDKEIKIKRDDSLVDLREKLSISPVVVVSGPGGVGKTAVVKQFLNSITAPYFLFRAAEFNELTQVNQLFNSTEFTLQNLIEEHSDIEEKYIIIDSAEKLTSLRNLEVFREFLSALLLNKWKIIFTTRHSYLDALKFNFVEFYNIQFRVIDLQILEGSELENISSSYKFNLPKNTKLRKLLCNPFYLNEYLKIYKDLASAATHLNFYEALWKRSILGAESEDIQIKRGRCFLQIVQKRIDEGQFFVKADDLDSTTLLALKNDEIIGYDPKLDKYFIAHDIYEEWGIEKIIEKHFQDSEEFYEFFQAIGESLIIRRGFRNWLTNKLIDDPDSVKELITEALDNPRIESYWWDELLVAILMSEYSEIFFRLFESRLLEKDSQFLRQIISYLRRSCKDVDERMLEFIGGKLEERMPLGTIFTKPVGKGWECVIDFIFKNHENFGLEHMSYIIPVIEDWNQHSKVGNVTRNAALLALTYYSKIEEDENRAWSYSKQCKKLAKITANGAKEVKEELKIIFDEVIAENNTDRRVKYYELVEIALSSAGGSNLEIIIAMPDHVLKLAALFWRQGKIQLYQSSMRSCEDCFGIVSSHEFQYFPHSAFQTPMWLLLKYHHQKAINFILSFTNDSLESYIASQMRMEAEEINLVFEEGVVQKQHISNRLWNAYKGTQISTSLLESLHMALEKWLLEVGKAMQQKELEQICFDLLKRSKSASITAVVTSVVLANPDKLFNVAKVLIRTKELFLYDRNRIGLQSSAGLDVSFFGRDDYSKEIYNTERKTALALRHHQFSLEDLVFNHQLMCEEGDPFNKKKEIEEILDEYYTMLPHESDQTDKDKNWRLALARMDLRKMKLEVEDHPEGVIITRNPEIDSELRKHSEEPLKAMAEDWKYLPLKSWAEVRMKRKEIVDSKYPQYTSKELILSETREVLQILKDPNNEFALLFYQKVPALTCSVLIRDCADQLTNEEKEFCKLHIIASASLPLLNYNYTYQVSDGTEAAISVLPHLIQNFPQDKKSIKLLMMFLLLSPWREVSSATVVCTTESLWQISFNDSQDILLGYILMHPKFEKLSEARRNNNLTIPQVLERFQKENKSDLDNIASGQAFGFDFKLLDKIKISTMVTAIELMPLKVEDEVHKALLGIMLTILAKKIFQEEERNPDYYLKPRFLAKYTDLVLRADKAEVLIYLKPFLDEFKPSENMAGFFRQFIFAQDRLNKYENFWIIWGAFLDKIYALCDNPHYHANYVIRTFLFSSIFNISAKKWHSFKDKEKLFFKKIAADRGHHPMVFCSILELLDGPCSGFIDEGVFWISDIIKKNSEELSENLETNTVYYLESVIRKYLLVNHQTVKTSPKVKKDILTILNFLVKVDSSAGCLLRDHIL